MEKKLPFCPRDITDWATEPVPQRTRIKVPGHVITKVIVRTDNMSLPRNSARNSLTTGLMIFKLQQLLFLTIFSQGE